MKLKINKSSNVMVQLEGGLGNQMFQYALGRSLAYQNKAKFSGYFEQSPNGATPRKYNLWCFDLFDGFTIRSPSGITSKISRLRKKLFGEPGSIIREKSYSFDPEILKLSGDIQPVGYWQSEKYFQQISKIIRKDFRFKEPLRGKNAQVADKITSGNSISLHIRRGDYISNKNASQYHGVCDVAYYLRAVRYLKNKVSNPEFFIFSDDIQWAQDNLKLVDDATFIDWNQGQSSYIDMQLMSLCKHNIIANSSFSWWGAWLNDNPKKIVIAPKRWFLDLSVNTKDLIPGGWIRL